MKPKHTPGPWTVEERAKFLKISPRICNAPKKNPANAHLISAAPELLVLAKASLAMVEEMQSQFVHKLDPAVYKGIEDIKTLIKAALAKAQGES